MRLLRVLSLGGGVQSTSLALMADAGLFGEKPEVAFFADTGNEPPYVYETVEMLKELVSFPVKTVGSRNIAEDTRAGVNSTGTPGFIMIPAYVREGGSVNLGARQCTNNYKIVPINRGVREFLGCQRLSAKFHVELWLGISTDEVGRAKPNRNKYFTNRFPLLEEGWSREACASWVKEHFPSVPLGKSSCVICPFHSSDDWVRIAMTLPAQFAEAVEVDKAIRSNGVDQYLHASGLPLDEAVDMSVSTPNLFDVQDLVCDAGHCFM